MSKVVTLEEVLELAKQLSLVDKVSLIEQVTPQIKRELNIQPKHRKSLRGIWHGVNLSAQEIIDARKESWANFPRENI